MTKTQIARNSVIPIHGEVIEKKAVNTVRNKIYSSLGELFSDPQVAALCQFNPLLGGIATYFGGKYSQKQFDVLKTFTLLLAGKLKDIDEEKIDLSFFNTEQGKRIIGKVYKSILRDDREEKIVAMVNLTSKLYQINKINFDEREVYVDILDSLNVLQLSILDAAIKRIKERATDPNLTVHKGFGWELLSQHYQKIGISSALLLQSIRALESNGLINTNTVTTADTEKTHFVTSFGEQFHEIITSDNLSALDPLQ